MTKSIAFHLSVVAVFFFQPIHASTNKVDNTVCENSLLSRSATSQLPDDPFADLASSDDLLARLVRRFPQSQVETELVEVFYGHRTIWNPEFDLLKRIEKETRELKADLDRQLANARSEKEIAPDDEGDEQDDGEIESVQNELFDQMLRHTVDYLTEMGVGYVLVTHNGHAALYLNPFARNSIGEKLARLETEEQIWVRIDPFENHPRFHQLQNVLEVPIELITDRESIENLLDNTNAQIPAQRAPIVHFGSGQYPPAIRWADHWARRVTVIIDPPAGGFDRVPWAQAPGHYMLEVNSTAAALAKMGNPKQVSDLYRSALEAGKEQMRVAVLKDGRWIYSRIISVKEGHEVRQVSGFVRSFVEKTGGDTAMILYAQPGLNRPLHGAHTRLSIILAEDPDLNLDALYTFGLEAVSDAKASTTTLFRIVSNQISEPD